MHSTIRSATAGLALAIGVTAMISTATAGERTLIKPNNVEAPTEAGNETRTPAAKANPWLLKTDLLKKIILSASDCIPGFDAEPHPSDGKKYNCRSAAVTGVSGCNVPFTAMTNFTPQFAQGVFVYKCYASPAAPPPAQGVCGPNGFHPTLQDEYGGSVIYQCKSWQPSCGGSWHYNGVHSFGLAKFLYECQY